MSATKYPDNSLSSFKASDILKITIWAENKSIRDAIEQAAVNKQRICEFDEMSKEIEAELKDSGFIVKRVEMMGGIKITVKWA